MAMTAPLAVEEMLGTLLVQIERGRARVAAMEMQHEDGGVEALSMAAEREQRD